ncbi:hypothetical protein BsIDN1_67690 [Bacillus safensis]|uniref:ABC transporter permease n=1 Tax=Bacillus safensis TaxID=561879 RepID=A0A5S9MJM3_BACIA|nr:hypothetical protein BsIDN1_67690 [Bacillus safensis]
MSEQQIPAPVQQIKNSGHPFICLISFYRYGTILTIVVLIVIFAAANPAFLQSGNIINILRSISIVTIIAVGLTISLAVNGFDLSVGSVATLSNAIVISMFVWFSQNPLIAILSALAASIIVGLLNAWMIVKMKIPDMLMTLAMMFIIQGLAQTYTKGATISENMVLPDGTFSTGTIPAFFQQNWTGAIYHSYYGCHCTLCACFHDLHKSTADSCTSSVGIRKRLVCLAYM